ncbi:MAG: CCA tRNA nucleotidyltransferase [Inquilinaceae bacterium]
MFNESLVLDIQDWRSDPSVEAVIGALETAGGAPRFVGGCVRDRLLGRSVADIDVASVLPPTAAMAALKDAGLRVVPTGIDHGTITAVAAGRAIEVTTLRRDVSTDGRHAVVAFTDDWREDAARRDFTMNALSADRDGRVYDYFDGVADARAGRVRFIGRAADRIAEDVLRILRFFRFYAHYGTAPPDAEALEACRRMASAVPGLSAERIRNEVLKLLTAPDPAPAWRLMVETGVAVHAVGGNGDVGRLSRLIALAPTSDPVLRLRALLPDATDLAERLRLSTAERDRLAALAHLRVHPDMDDDALRRALHRHGAGTFGDAVLLAWAAGPSAAGFARLTGAAQDWRPQTLPVGGGDVLALGIEPGPAVGRLLAAVEEWWIGSGFTADRNACLSELRRRVAQVRD